MVPQSQLLCTFTVGSYNFAVEVRRVQEVLRFQEMTRVPLAPSVVRGLINLRGQIVTAIDLRRHLGLPDAPARSSPMSVILGTEQGAVSLLVDNIGDVREAARELFEPPPPTLRDLSRELIQGVYKLPDMLLILLDADLVIAPVVALTKKPAPSRTETQIASRAIDAEAAGRQATGRISQ